MLNIRATIKSILPLRNGRTAVTFEAAVNPENIEELGEDVAISLKKWHKQRTKGQNAYFWACVSDIAAAQKQSVKEVHDKEIMEHGVGQYLQLHKVAVEDFKKRWGEPVRVLSEKDGMVEVFAYYGSATYDTAEMSRLIDGTIQDMQALGLHVPAKEDWF